jgi:hypothetical protein
MEQGSSTLQNSMEVKLPDGNMVSIREQTGEDEDVLSRVRDAQDGTAMNNFLSNLIIDSSYKSTTPKDILMMKSRVRNYILLSSRIFSLGSELDFTHTFSDGDSVDFTENLDDYLFDYEAEDFPLPGEPNYNGLLCCPYPEGDPTCFESELGSEKIVRMEYLTGLSEKKALELGQDTSINSKLTIRNFELKVDDRWQSIQRFNMFTSKDMREIRKLLLRNDPEFELVIKLTSPQGLREEVSLFTIPDFFFPRD